MAIISKNTIVWELLDKVTGPLDRIAEGTTKTKQALENAKFSIQSSGSDLEKLGRDAGDSARNFQEGFQKITGSAKEGAQGIIDFSSSKNQFHQATAAIKGDNDETAKSFIDGTAVLKTAKEKIHDVTQEMEKMPGEKKTKFSVIAEDGKVREFSNEVKKTPKERQTTFKAKVSDAVSKIKGLGHEEDELGKKSTRLKDILLGTFAGNLIAGGIAAITGKLHEAIEAGAEYNKEQDTMRTVWHALTTEAPKDGKELLGFINDISQHSIYAADNVNEMAQSFYHVHSNVAETKRWTNDFIALGSTLHMTGSQVSEAAEMFAKMQASGKVGAEDMAVMINRFPMFGEAVQKATGKSMKELYKLSSQGKLTADVFAKAMDEMGEKYKDGTKEAMTSAQGMGMYISSRMVKLSGDIQKSSFDLSKGVQHDIQSILSDGSLEQMAGGISKALGGMMTGISHVISYIADHKDTIVDIIGNLKTIVGIFAGTIWQTAKDIIGDIAGVFGTLSGSAGKTKDPLKNIDNILKEIADHKEAIQAFAKVMLGFFAAKKALSFAKGIKEVSKSIGLLPNEAGNVGILGKAFSSLGKGIGKAAKAVGGPLLTAFKTLGGILLGNPIFLVAAAIVGVGVAFYEAYKHIKPFHDAVDKAVAAVKKFGSGVIAGAKKALDWVKDNWKEIGLYFVNPVAGVVNSLYKHNAGFRKWADDTIESVTGGLKSGWKHVSKWWSDTKKSISKAWHSLSDPIVKGVEGFFSDIYKTGQKWAKTLLAGVKKIWNGVALAFEVGFWLVWGPIRLLGQQIQKAAEKLWGWVRPYITKAINEVKKILDKFVNAAQDIWEDLNKFTQKAFKLFSKYVIDPVKSAAHAAHDAINWLKAKTIDIFQDLRDETKKIFDRFRRNIIDPVNDAKNKAIAYIRSLWDDLVDRFNSLRAETAKIWERIKHAITDPITDTWHKVTRTVSNLYNDVLGWWDRLKDGTISRWDKMLDYVSGIPKRMGDALSNGAHWVGDGAKAIGNYMVGKIGDGVNGVIGGIDWVLDKVHAPKSVRIPKWDVPKFATGGTHRGGLMMVNDGEGPELVRHPDGRMEIPHARDVIMNAEPGTQVLNHQQTRFFAKMAGIPMYADGIGDFFSNVWDGIKDIGEDIVDAVSHPIKFVEKAIAKHVKLDATHPVLDIGVGAVKTMTSGAMDWIKGLIDKFGSQLLESTGGGSGTRGQFLKLAEQQQGKPYVWGAAGPDAFDCSGLVMWALQQLGISFPHFSGSQFNASQPISEKDAKPGDLVFFGPGGNDHVGIVAGSNRMFNAMNPKDGIGFSPIHGFGEALAGFRRVTQLTDKSSAGAGRGNPSGAGVDRWRGQLIDALKANGLPTSESYVSAWLRQIATESSGDPNARQGIVDVNSFNGSGGAMGLLQTIPPTFNAYKFPGHGNIFNGYDNMLAAINYAKHAYGGNMLAVIGQGHGYQEGGNPKRRQLAWLAEDGEEFVINPKKPNALSLAFNALQSIEREQPALAGVSQYDYNPGSYGAAEGQRAAHNAGKQNGSWINDKLDRIIDYLETIAKKDTDVYIDGDKVTDHVNEKNTNRLDILQTIN
ncbi:tape measure protein [Enterococcus faecium]